MTDIEEDLLLKVESWKAACEELERENLSILSGLRCFSDSSKLAYISTDHILYFKKTCAEVK